VISLRRHGTPLLVAAAVLAGGGLFAALLGGRPEAAAIASPFLLTLVVALPLGRAPVVQARLLLDTDRALEGESLTGRLVVEVQGAQSVEVLLEHLTPLLQPEEPGPRLAWWVPPGRHELPFRVRTTAWGFSRLGPLHVRAHTGFGLVRWRGQSDAGVGIRALPPAARLRALLGPDEPRVTAGSHLARRRGEGFEFAEVRPYGTGDRLRHVNWPVSSRRGQLWVNQRHPERSADLVLLVDTFAEQPGAVSPALIRAVRAAWMLTSRHLDAHDRVGVVCFGGYPSWLPARGGERARYALLDRLLAAQATYTEAPRRLAWLPPRALPAGALVIALTPLLDDRMRIGLAELRRRGTEVVALVIAVPEPATNGTWVEELALRLWRMEQQRARERLVAAGVPVVEWPLSVEPAVVLEMLGRLRARRLSGARP